MTAGVENTFSCLRVMTEMCLRTAISLFRFYGPGEAVFDQSFALPDFEKVN